MGCVKWGRGGEGTSGVDPGGHGGVVRLEPLLALAYGAAELAVLHPQPGVSGLARFGVVVGGSSVGLVSLSQREGGRVPLVEACRLEEGYVSWVLWRGS